MLCEVSFCGAAYVVAEIEWRCGVHRSVRALEMRAAGLLFAGAPDGVFAVYGGLPPGAGAWLQRTARVRAGQDAAVQQPFVQEMRTQGVMGAEEVRLHRQLKG